MGQRIFSSDLLPVVKSASELPSSTLTPSTNVSITYHITLDGNLTIANPGTMPTGTVLRFVFEQDSTGGRSVSWGNKYNTSSFSVKQGSGQTSSVDIVRRSDGSFDVTSSQGIDRASRPISITDYGAVGDGSTDNTAAIQAACDALTSGGILYFPAGSYKFTAKLAFEGVDGVTLQGAGNNTILLPYGALDSALELLDCDYPRISNLQINGINMTGTGPGVVLDGSSHGRIEGCKILNTPGYGVKLGQFSSVSGSYFNILDGNHFFNCGRLMDATDAANIYSGSEASETKIIGGECQSSPGTGWLIDGANGCTGLGASFEGNSKTGVKVGTVSNAGEVSLFGCRFEGAGVMERGILIGNANSTLLVMGCHMTSCTVSDIDNTVASSKVAWLNITPSTTPAGNSVGLKVRNANGVDLGALNITETGGAPTVQGPSLKIQSSSNDLQLESATDIISSLAAVLRFSGNSRVDTSGSSTLYLGSSSNTLIADAPLSCASRFIPQKVSTAQRDALTSVASGTLVYNTTTNKMNFYNGSTWEEVTST